MSETGAAKPAVGVGGVVFDAQGRVLLVRRARPPQAGLWHIPGGRLEVGETLAECCRREVLEETGIEVRPGPIVAVADRAIEGFHYIIIDFLAERVQPDGGDPQPSSDASDARWVHPDELSTYPLVKGLREVIAAAHAGMAAGEGAGLAAASDCSWLYLAKGWEDGAGKIGIHGNL